MIACWLIGDLLKTLYYSKFAAPIQLLSCALFQIALDIIILGQFFVYSKNPASESKPKFTSYQATEIEDKHQQSIAVPPSVSIKEVRAKAFVIEESNPPNGE